MSENELIELGIEIYIQRIKKCKEIYLRILENLPKNFEQKIYKIKDREIFQSILTNFTPALEQKMLKKI